MVCLNQHDAAGFVLRQAKGPQLKLDFGRTLKAPPNGLRGNQLVEVMGTLVPGGNTSTQWCSYISATHGLCGTFPQIVDVKGFLTYLDLQETIRSV